MRAYYNTETRALIASDGAPSDEAGRWRVLPRKVGVIWHSDQSQNQIVLGGPPSIWKTVDYTFDPAEDMALLAEYKDQIEEHYQR